MHSALISGKKCNLGDSYSLPQGPKDKLSWWWDLCSEEIILENVDFGLWNNRAIPNLCRIIFPFFRALSWCSAVKINSWNLKLVVKRIFVIKVGKIISSSKITCIIIFIICIVSPIIMDRHSGLKMDFFAINEHYLLVSESSQKRIWKFFFR